MNNNIPLSCVFLTEYILCVYLLIIYASYCGQYHLMVDAIFISFLCSQFKNQNEYPTADGFVHSYDNKDDTIEGDVEMCYLEDKNQLSM